MITQKREKFREVKAPPRAGLPAPGGDGIPGATTQPPPQYHAPQVEDFSVLLGKNYLLYQRTIATWKLSVARYWRKLAWSIFKLHSQASRTSRSPMLEASRTSRLQNSLPGSQEFSLQSQASRTSRSPKPEASRTSRLRISLPGSKGPFTEIFISNYRFFHAGHSLAGNPYIMGPYQIGLCKFIYRI